MDLAEIHELLTIAYLWFLPYMLTLIRVVTIACDVKNILQFIFLLVTIAYAFKVTLLTNLSTCLFPMILHFIPCWWALDCFFISWLVNCLIEWVPGMLLQMAGVLVCFQAKRHAQMRSLGSQEPCTRSTRQGKRPMQHSIIKRNKITLTKLKKNLSLLLRRKLAVNVLMSLFVSKPWLLCF